VPDFGLLILIFLFLFIAGVCFSDPVNDSCAFLVGLLFLGLVALDIVWWVNAYSAFDATSTYKMVDSFEIQTITSKDGSRYQIYIDYNSGTVHNVTQRWNKIVPEGTMVVRLERQERWAMGVRFFMPSHTKDELRGPLDDRWDGPPNVRIENDN